MAVDIEVQWQDWLKLNPGPYEHIDENELKECLVKDLSVVSKMTVGEYTLYQKWLEVHQKYPTQKIDTIFGEKTVLDQEQRIFLEKTKQSLWFPESPNDYLKLKPELIMTDNKSTEEVETAFGKHTVSYKRDAELNETWNAIRVFTSTMKNNSNVGRSINYLVRDQVTQKHLGVICISSDFLDLTPRDEAIGWSRERKTTGHMINHTAIGSTIVPIQPLGFNYVGGKLLALLCLSDKVQDDWKRLYGDTLVGVTTTSLYGKTKSGGLSQYDNLKHWKKMGYSNGTVAYDPSKKTRKMLEMWLKENHTRKYFEWYAAKKDSGPYMRDHKNRSFHFAYRKLGIPSELIKSEHQRGIYFSSLYTNSFDFLTEKIDASKLVKSFDTSYDYLTELWKDKYARKRIEGLERDGRVSSEVLFMDDIIYMNWEETKAKYLPDVGR